MIRLFREHSKRKVESLDGLWDFKVNGDKESELPEEYNDNIYVPSVWEQKPGLESYRGKAYYKKELNVEQTGPVRLVFGGISHTARIYLDGKKQKYHYDAYTPFEVIMEELESGEHILEIEVDNSFGPESALHRESDYYTYGGITRPVEIQYISELYIDRIYAVPNLKNDGTWELEIKIKLNNISDKKIVRNLILDLEEVQKIDLGKVEVEAGEKTEIETKVDGLGVRPWSPEDPELYKIKAFLLNKGKVEDDKIDRIGFREVEVEGRDILINKEPVQLKGYNRHEDHPHFGCAIPVEAMMKDLEIMQDLSCNFVRTSHYPNDMRFLDLCDELGFYVWEESHYRNVPLDHPQFKEQMETNTREMIDWHFNHPSLVLWGCLNESESDTEFGRKIHKWLLELIKELDPDRPVTFASNSGQDDLCLEYVDVVSWNRYAAWYESSDPDYIKEALQNDLDWLHSEESNGGKDKPVIMSEFGAGALRGYREPHAAKWTEEYQEKVLDESLKVYLNHPDIAGTAIWQFCDIRVTEGYFRGRPRTMNNKGTVDQYRRPKLAYDIVKKRMQEAENK